MKLRQKNPTTISSWVLAVAETLKSYGHDSDKILEQAGIDKNVLLNPDARFKVKDLAPLWKLAVKVTGDPCFGLSVAAHVRPTTFHALGFAIMASSSLNDIIQRLLRYYRIVSNSLNLELEDFGDTMAISFKPYDEGPRPPDEALDAVIATAISFAKLVVSDDIKSLKIEFMRKKPENSERFEKFFKVPVIFSADSNRIFLNKTDIYKPMPAANVEIARHNDQIVAEYLERFHKSHIVYQVHAKLIDILPMGEPSLEKIAKALGMSKRNLNRSLKNESSTYKEMLNETRRYLAMKYLKQSDLSIIDVAFRLGYSDSSNFTRAFKRWFGVSPKGYRGKTP